MTQAAHKSRKLNQRMVPRDAGERHRAATPLELLYDLCFVVAIAQVAAALHHSISHGHALAGIGSFGVVFFAIWWAWMGFAWFASSFDTDDVAYRVKVLIQMVGVLVLAAGVPRAFESMDASLLTLGYAIMRVGLVAQWLRAGRVPEYRRTAHRYAIGITLCQILWIVLLFLPGEWWIYGWFVLVPLELLVPVWGERAKPTSWHPHHIAERYGLLTIIVLGESVLAGTLAIQSSLDLGTSVADLLQVIVAAPLIVFSMWWLYFSRSHAELLNTMRAAFAWGYGHVVIFASAAAVGAGLAVAVDHATHKSHISDVAAGHALAIPVVLYLAGLWALMLRPTSRSLRCGAGFAVCAVLVLLAPLTPIAPLAIGVLLAALTAYTLVAESRR
jgi:low temperature requirement protein LtrA